METSEVLSLCDVQRKGGLSCDELCLLQRRNFSYLASIGFVAFFVYQSTINQPDTYENHRFFYIFRAINLFDNITLPRSIIELKLILENKGFSYYEITAVHHAALSIAGLCLLTYSLRRSTFYIDQKSSTSTSKKVLAAVIIVSLILLFRPPEFVSGSLFLNRVDNIGLYFIREAALIAAGYYNAYVVILNIWVSVVTK